MSETLQPRYLRYFAVSLMIVYAAAGGAFAAAPPYINYQGRLSNSQGQPLATGDYALTFRLYDVPSGGTPLWGPQIFDDAAEQGHGRRVPVVQGHFNVILGPVDTAANGGRSITKAFAPQSLADAGVRYLEIQVGTNSPITPRQQILAAPFAAHAQHAANGVPAGTIIPFYGTASEALAQQNDGWWICDGRTINDPQSTRYHNQPAPNLTGIFLRGGAQSGTVGGSDTAAVPGHALDADVIGWAPYTIHTDPRTGICCSGNTWQHTHPLRSRVNVPGATLSVVPRHMSVIYLLKVK